jgi:hypothetical protein
MMRRENSTTLAFTGFVKPKKSLEKCPTQEFLKNQVETPVLAVG